MDGTSQSEQADLRAADIRSVALTGIFILLVFYTFYFARAVLLPITLALLLNFLLRPVIGALERIHIRPALGAALVLLAFVAVVGAAGYELSRPAAQWVAKAPQVMRDVQEKVRGLRRPVEKVSTVAEKVSQMTAGGADQKTPEVKIKKSYLSEGVLTGTQSFLGSLVVVAILVYFMLASGDFFLRKLIKVLPTLADKKRALTIAKETEHQISRYLLTVTAINSCLGLALGTAFYFLGLPNPFLWGALGGALNYIPYLGATVGITLTTFVALLTFNSLGHTALVPLVYFAINSVEGSFITPWVMGRSLTLNPVVIFIWLILWGWLWGVPGALIAVPMLAVFKIFCDHIEPLSTLGEFLGSE